MYVKLNDKKAFWIKIMYTLQEEYLILTSP